MIGCCSFENKRSVSVNRCVTKQFGSQTLQHSLRLNKNNTLGN